MCTTLALNVAQSAMITSCQSTRVAHGSPQCSTLPLVWMHCDEGTRTAGGSGARRGPQAASAALSTQSERL